MSKKEHHRQVAETNEISLKWGETEDSKTKCSCILDLFTVSSFRKLQKNKQKKKTLAIKLYFKQLWFIGRPWINNVLLLLHWRLNPFPFSQLDTWELLLVQFCLDSLLSNACRPHYGPVWDPQIKSTKLCLQSNKLHVWLVCFFAGFSQRITV